MLREIRALKNSKIYAFFILVVISLSIPLFYLLWANESDHALQLNFTTKEVDGLRVAEAVFKEYDTLTQDFSYRPPKKKEVAFHTREEWSSYYYYPLLRDISNHSNLILDPDLDSYYMMDVAFLRTAKINQILCMDSAFVNVEHLMKEVLRELSELEYSLNTALKTSTLTFETREEMRQSFIRLRDEINAQLSTQKKFSPMAISQLNQELGIKGRNFLKKMLMKRIQNLSHHHQQIFYPTLLFWLIGCLSGFILIQRLLKRQTDAFEALAERQLMLQNAEKLSTLGELASSIAHEIKNPLAVIAMDSKSLQKYIPTELSNYDLIIKRLNKMHEMSERIDRISKTLGTYARKADKDPVRPENIKNIINEAIYITNLKAKKLDVTLSLLEADGIALCRKTEIEQVLINLINNAIDALENSSIEKRIELTAGLSMKNNQAMIKMTVCDNGPGIPAEARDKIFDSFYTTKESGKGTGLGLSISKSIIEAHGGTIDLDKESPMTTFVIFLPTAS